MSQAPQVATSHVGEPLPYEDTPVFFPAGGEMLFGISTSPRGETRGTTVTMLTGGGYVTSTHRNRMYVRLSRRIAGLGYHSLRFDYHGTGESTGAAERFHIDEPFVDDLQAALTWLGAQGVERHVLVGSCFGARTALACAPSLPGLEGLVLLSPPARDLRYVQGKGKVEHEALNGDELSPGFLDPFRHVVERGVPVLVVYGMESLTNQDFQRQELRAIVEAGGSLVDARALEGPVQQFASVAVQDEVIALVTDWLAH